jgi:putative Ca2+/H+ antiporter (TMEM165/GDT1 family)
MVAYVLISSILLAIFSTISDRIPFQTAGRPPLELALYVLGGVFNNLAIWYLLAVLFGYHFGRSWPQAVLGAALYIIFAITLYFIASALATPEARGGLSLPLPWYLASAAGGAAGGATGFLAQRQRVAWLAPVAFIVIQVVRYGARVWQRPVDVAQNVLLLLIATTIAIYAATRPRERRFEEK